MQKGPVLVFGDVHAPFHHKNTLSFLKETYDRYNCQSVVCDGDLVDFHRSSRHTSEVDAISAVEEYEKYIEFAEELVSIFPEGDMVPGNHCFIPKHQMKELGLSPALLKEDLFALGSGWKIHDHYYTMDFGKKGKVVVEHGTGSNGMNGAINTAIAKRVSFVQGHTHCYGGINWRMNHDGPIFGLNTGWLGDEHSYAMRYGKYSRFAGVHGCGVVFSPTDAIFEKMQLD